jgi:UDP-GlcNAc:undecaprenyl-phosphate GlcNAc-1-phosphate transferase
MGHLDRPSDRKAHLGTIPLIGGIYNYSSVVIGSVAFLDLPETFIGIPLICGLVTFIGALDDRYPLQPVYRQILQLMAGVTIASMGISGNSLSNLVGLGKIDIALIAIPFTAIAITGLCNAYNIVDGIDDLAGSLT